MMKETTGTMYTKAQLIESIRTLGIKPDDTLLDDAPVPEEWYLE